MIGNRLIEFEGLILSDSYPMLFLETTMTKNMLTTQCAEDKHTYHSQLRELFMYIQTQLESSTHMTWQIVHDSFAYIALLKYTLPDAELNFR